MSQKILWWLAFLEGKPPRSKWYCIVEIDAAETPEQEFSQAVMQTHWYRCNPGLEATGTRVPDSLFSVLRPYTNVLITPEEAKVLFYDRKQHSNT